MDDTGILLKPENYDVEKFLGKWYVVRSSYPLWLKEGVSDVCIYYTLMPHPHKIKIRDTVNYIQNNLDKKIRGIDFCDLSYPYQLTWQGRNLLTSLIKCNWQILALEKNYKWAVIFFENTFFSPQGMDIIARYDHLDENTYAHIEESLRPSTVFNAYREKLASVKHTLPTVFST